MNTDLASLGPTLIPPPPSPSTAANFQEMRALMSAWVAWELEEAQAQREAREMSLPARRATKGPTSVCSVRLDHAEQVALEQRAAMEGIKPGELARRFIRRGLTARDGRAMDAAVAEAVRSLEEVTRALADAME